MTIRNLIAVSLITLLAACHSKGTAQAADDGARQQTIEPYATIAITPEALQWADSVMMGLTPEEQIAQLFVPRLDITSDAAGYARIKEMLSTYGMGGLLFGKGSLDTYVKLLNHARKVATVPPMITFDGEWGLAMRIPDSPRFPYAMALGATRSQPLMEAYGREVARECRILGIHVNFAPDLDVNSNPANPVIGFRSLGGDAENVGLLGAAYCIGMADGDVMPVGKHFPGHGDTSVDSHHALPTVDHSVERLTDYDMLPFSICIRAGMPAVMVGHLRVPALDPSGTPASLSPVITTKWLRDSLKFNGLIFTDALAMKGARADDTNNCVSALLAGADILLGSGAPVADFKAVKAAVATGIIPADTITARCRRVLAYKYSLGCQRNQQLELQAVSQQLNSPACSKLIDSLCTASVTLLSDRMQMLPIKSDTSTVVVIGNDAEAFVTAYREYSPQSKFFTMGKASKITAPLRRALLTPEVTVVVTSAQPWAVSAYKSILEVNSGICTVFMLNAYKLTSFPVNEEGATMITYDCFPAMCRAAARAVLGYSPITGRMPVDVPSRAHIMQGITLIPPAR